MPLDPPSSSSSDSAPPRAGGFRLSRNALILGFTSLANDIGSEMIFPLMPRFLLSLGGSKSFLGLIEGSADSLASFLKLWSGRQSDRAARRKPFLVAGYALTSAVRPLIAFVTRAEQLLAIRLADRLGKGVRAAPRDAMLADSTTAENHGWAFGFNRAMDHLGAMIGPLVATLLLTWFEGDVKKVFLASAVPSAIVVILAAWGLREKRRQAQSSAEAAGPPASLASAGPNVEAAAGASAAGAGTNEGLPSRLGLSLAPLPPQFRWYMLSLLVFTLGNSSDAFLLVRAEELGVAPTMLPALWGAFHVVKSLSNLFFGSKVQRIGPRPLILAGWALYAVIYFGFAAATTAAEAWVCFLIYALYYGLTEPAEKTLVASLAGAKNKGLAFGWYNFTLGIASLPASMLLGALYQTWGAAAAFSTGAGLAAVASLLLLAVRFPPRPISPAAADHPG